MMLRFIFILALCFCPFPWVFAADEKNDHGDHAEFSHAMGKNMPGMNGA